MARKPRIGVGAKRSFETDLTPQPPVPRARPEKPFVPPPWNPVKALTRNRKKHKARNSFGFDDFTQQERDGVAHLASIAFTERQIAKILGVSVDALRANFEEELTIGRLGKIAAVAENMYETALSDRSGSVAAGMYILKQHGGEQWREVQRTELTGPDGAPLQVEQRVIDPARLSDEDREALRDMMLKAIAKPVTVIEGQIIENGSDADDMEDLV